LFWVWLWGGGWMGRGVGRCWSGGWVRGGSWGGGGCLLARRWRVYLLEKELVVPVRGWGESFLGVRGVGGGWDVVWMGCIGDLGGRWGEDWGGGEV